MNYLEHQKRPRGRPRKDSNQDVLQQNKKTKRKISVETLFDDDNDEHFDENMSISSLYTEDRFSGNIDIENFSLQLDY